MRVGRFKTRSKIRLPNVSGNAQQMTHRNIIGLLFLFGAYSCIDNDTIKHQPDKHFSERRFDINIENGQGRGFLYSDFIGHKYFCRNHTTTITNDGAVPIHLKISLSNNFYYVDPNDSLKSRVFLLPRQVNPKSKDFDSGTTKELKNYLDSSIDIPISIDKIINSKESYAVTFGLLTEKGVQSVGEIALISKESSSTILLDLKLDRDSKQSNPLIIPCGQITFTK